MVNKETFTGVWSDESSWVETVCFLGEGLEVKNRS